MERMIEMVWRAVWIALGAALVLVGQSVLAPPVPPPPTVLVAPAPIPEPITLSRADS